jgi:hypothetical protein
MGVCHIMIYNLYKNLVFCCIIYKRGVNLRYELKQSYLSSSYAIQKVSWDVGMYILYLTKGLTN